LSPLPTFAALFSLAAALVALLRPAMAPSRAVRTLGVLAALAMVPSLEEPTSWPAVALVVGAAVFATPLPCLFGAAAAAMVALGAMAPRPEALAAPVVAAMALAASAASFGSESDARLRKGADRGWPAAWAGLAFCVVAALQGEGQTLAWRFGLGAPEVRGAIPGAGILAGLALLVTLSGSLALLAHLLTPGTPSAPVRRFGEGALVLGATFGILAVGFALFRGAATPAVLTASASGLVALMLATAALAAALVILLGPPLPGEPQAGPGQADFEARIGAGLAVAAAGLAGFEGWLRLGTYATPLAGAAASAALLALAVLEPTKLGLARKALWLLALAFVVAA
jgi:hypothetical protein